ncbi:hypothetical protein [Nonomuraea endophytica]|uniref:Uncharacterized protein n=1 Tax=Nonomuraea endophytica TaxID=714136 RepID=A0A7W8A1Y5_9ACTN|nr:hypothetical protein [Nonomuraea endophytica]MBB5077479.1 hypothetical protein [Nonomuraea endophytica]
MADHDRREDELLVPAPRDDDKASNDIHNDDIKNDHTTTNDIANDHTGTDDIANDHTRTDDTRDDYDTRAVYDTQPSASPVEATPEHEADRTREPYTLPADDRVPPAPPYPTAVETAPGSGQEFGDGAYTGGGEIADRWRDVQAGFVDDPRAAVERADDLLEELLRDVTRQAGEMRESWKSQQDTEQLRLALREYRSVMERLMAFSERK